MGIMRIPKTVGSLRDSKERLNSWLTGVYDCGVSIGVSLLNRWEESIVKTCQLYAVFSKDVWGSWTERGRRGAFLEIAHPLVNTFSAEVLPQAPSPLLSISISTGSYCAKNPGPN